MREMVGKIPIPEEIRWQSAAKIASMIPVAYGMAFRDRIGPDYERLEQQVWVALAHEAMIVARTFSLPVGNARELTSALDILNSVFFGPEIKSEQVSFESDRAVLLVRKCPLMLREQELHAPPGNVFNRCLAFSIAVIEELNPEYTLRFIRGMCQGDRNCEMKIITKKAAEEAEKKK
ncbi:MAG: hypothetical protein LUQ12_01345 [Methanoregulaceae archaeon]|nr:hypothetical protein [Methanoregulaceae archaeon]